MLVWMACKAGPPIEKTGTSLEKTVGKNDKRIEPSRRHSHSPGVLAFNPGGEVLYLNQRGSEFLDRISLTEGFYSRAGRRIPLVIIDLLVRLDRQPAAGAEGTPGEEQELPHRVLIHDRAVYLLRALRLRQRGGEGSGHFLILVEEASAGVETDQCETSTGLTEREGRVVRLLLEGKKNKAIASKMKITEHTVKEHVKRIMKRLNVTTRSGIVAAMFHRHSGRTIHENSSTALPDAFRIR